MEHNFKDRRFVRNRRKHRKSTINVGIWHLMRKRARPSK